MLYTLCSPKLAAQSLQKIYSGLDKATSISVTQNSIYIVEQGKNRLLKLDHQGKLLESIGGKGSGDYQFSKPVDVDATNGLKIFVTDYNNRRIQVFDRRGQYLSSISARRGFGNNRKYEPTYISVNNLGEVFFVDESANKIYRFDLDSNLLDEFRMPTEIKSVDDLIVNGQQILILDLKTQTIHELALNGSYQGFYPTEGVKAFFVNDQDFWKVFGNRAKGENQSKEIKNIHFEKDIEPVDMRVINGIMYILTNESLFRILPE
ncbi:MAG: NHL repeat-containing protein [Balneolaceae bacterium]